MGHYTDPRALARAQRRRFDAVKRSVESAHAQVAESCEHHARFLTSGQITPEERRYLDYPYARRHGQPLLPLLAINLVTGQLQRSLRLFKRITAGRIVWRLQFTSPHAIVLRPQGTRYMFARKFWESLREHYKRINRPAIIGAIKRAYRS